MAYRFNIGAIIKLTLNLIRNITISFIIYTDLKSLYNCLVRFMVDFICLRQLYKCKEIAKIKWIKGNTNLANFITKLKVYNALKQLINTNKVNISIIK